MAPRAPPGLRARDERRAPRAGRIELTIETRPTLLRFCVRDEGAGRPKQRPPGADGGFGLHLVADLSDRWGHGGSGTCVWFEVGRQKVA